MNRRAFLLGSSCFVAVAAMPASSVLPASPVLITDQMRARALAAFVSRIRIVGKNVDDRTRARTLAAFVVESRVGRGDV